jgi:hypothetical protein
MNHIPSNTGVQNNKEFLLATSTPGHFIQHKNIIGQTLSSGLMKIISFWTNYRTTPAYLRMVRAPAKHRSAAQLVRLALSFRCKQFGVSYLRQSTRLAWSRQYPPSTEWASAARARCLRVAATRRTNSVCTCARETSQWDGRRINNDFSCLSLLFFRTDRI